MKRCTITYVGMSCMMMAVIGVVAIHQHMTMESPRVIFLHYWGVGPTRVLATGLKATLATQRH